jgi:alpha-L-fucosidase
MLLSPLADYYSPEQQIGAYDDDRPWETCMTLGTQWSWKPDDKTKSAGQVISLLARTVGGDGNLLLDVGPMPDGRIEPRQVEVLKQVGAWLKENGDSIYGTRGGPWKPTPSITSTRKGKTIYVHILKWPAGPVKLSGIPAKIVSAKVPGGGKAEVRQTECGIEISVAAADRDANDTVITLKLDSKAEKIPAIDMSPAAKTVTTGSGRLHGHRLHRRVVYPSSNYGLASLKNRWSAGGAMVTLLVPLAVVAVPP